MRKVEDEPGKGAPPGRAVRVGMAVAGLGLVALALWPITTCACSTVPLEPGDFRVEYIEANRVLTAQATGERVVAVVSGGEGSAVVEVDTRGAPLQALMRDLAASGATLIHRGEGTLRLEILGLSPGDPGIGMRLRPADGSRGCEPCASGEALSLEAGPYHLEVIDGDWSLVKVEVRDEDGVYAAEVIPAGEVIYLPEGAALAVETSLARTGG